MVSLDRFGGHFDTIDNPSSKRGVSSKSEDANLNVLNMITGVKESKTGIKHFSCDCR